MADDKKEKKDEKGKGEEAAPQAAPTKSKKKLFIIIGAVVFLIAAIGAPVAYMSLRPKNDQTQELAGDAASEDSETGSLEGSADEDQLQEGEKALGAIFPLESFVVNLQGGRYIRCQVQLEFEERDVPQRFYQRLVPIRDSMIRLLAGKTAEDMVSEKGKDGLKVQVKDTVNEILKKEEVKNVYFTQFVVQ